MKNYVVSMFIELRIDIGNQYGGIQPQLKSMLRQNRAAPLRIGMNWLALRRGAELGHRPTYRQRPIFLLTAGAPLLPPLSSLPAL